MSNSNLILAIDSNGNDITVSDITNWLKAKSKKKLSDFIYNRFYGRYLKPFDYDASDYKKSFKNGFSIMANCCLLIETYVSFTRNEFRSTHQRSEKAFGYFFTTENRFSVFSQGGQPAAHYLSNAKLIKSGIPHDFYSNVRCGILHSGETKNGWKINRLPAKPLFDLPTKDINATEFANVLKKVIDDYRKKLNASDFDSDDIWICFKNRLSDVITNA